MKAPTVLALAFAGLSAAQLGALPTCAQSCANEFFAGSGGYAGCGTDPKCICSNTSFIGAIACCLAGTCDAADQAAAVAYAQQICQANGVSVPSAVSCTSTVSSASSTASGSVSASTTPSTATTSTSASASASVASTASSSSSHNFAAAPKPTGAALGALGGIVAAMAML